MISIISGTGCAAKCSIDDALRYMGVKGDSGDDINLLNTLKDLKDVLEKNSVFKACYDEFDLGFTQNGDVITPFGNIHSKNLYNHISGCTKAVVFCATIGIGADRLIKTQELISPSKAVMYDALASSLIENWCDKINQKIVGERLSKSRFSAGYGDFDIKYQKTITDYLNTYKNIGVSVTDYMAMVPSKSVTALVGIY